VDAIVHLASANEVACAKDMERALIINGVYTGRLLSAASQEKVSRFIYFSTAHVYGSPLAGVIDETVCPRPITAYAVSHRVAEDLVLSASRTGAMTGIVIRLSNSFGAPAHREVDRWSLLVNDLCRQVAESGRLVLRTAGTQRRDFITLRDVGQAVRHLLEIPPSAVGDGLFNLGGAWAPRIYEMAELIQLRFAARYGTVPPLIRPAVSNELDESLEYKIDKLTSTGFRLEGDVTGEIDKMLDFCVDALTSSRATS
jgi:UDP-glucose 4-epimerase